MFRPRRVHEEGSNACRHELRLLRVPPRLRGRGRFRIVFFFIPTDRRLLPIIQKALADAGERELQLADLPPTYQRWGRAEGFVGAFMGILLIAAIFFMTTKPGLG
ncbi:MAG TPA: hypothetical protein VI028_04585 [Solirubrobacterales bacterium]